MNKYPGTIKIPLILKRNSNILPRQYHQNFRSSSVLKNSGHLPSKMPMTTTSSSFPSKTYQIDQNDRNEAKSEDELVTANQNDLLLNTNPNYDDILFSSSRMKPSSLFNSSLSATGTANSMPLKLDKFGMVTAIVGLPHMNIDQDQAMRGKSMEQKKELLEILETNNLSPSEILLKISTYSTPYSKLLKLAYEELQFTTTTGHSAQIDELERNAAVTSAKKEIEIQQLTDKSIKLKNEHADLKKALKKSQNRLQTLNSDIESLNKMAEMHGIDISKEIPKSAKSKDRNNDLYENNDIKNDSDIDESEKDIIQNEKGHHIPLDDELYKSLWSEHTSLLDEIEELQKQLTKTQAKQAVAFHETVQKIKASRKPRIF